MLRITTEAGSHTDAIRSVSAKDAARNKIKADVEAYLASGKQLQQVPSVWNSAPKAQTCHHIGLDQS